MTSPRVLAFALFVLGVLLLLGPARPEPWINVAVALTATGCVWGETFIYWRWVFRPHRQRRNRRRVP